MEAGTEGKRMTTGAFGQTPGITIVRIPWAVSACWRCGRETERARVTEKTITWVCEECDR